MKLLVDMNMSTLWIDALREAGFDARHWSDVGPASATDREIMDYARSIDAVVLTRDMDFSAILATNGLRKPSVVHLSDADRFQLTTVARVVLALRRFEEDLTAGAIVSMASGRARLRRLPIAASPRDG